MIKIGAGIGSRLPIGHTEIEGRRTRLLARTTLAHNPFDVDVRKAKGKAGETSDGVLGRMPQSAMTHKP